MTPTNGAWRKMYLNFTSVINEYTSKGQYGFQLFMLANGTNNTLYLDNLKLLYL
ncbi:MAG: hypothetical protein NTX03_00820 [Bacteroidetes bacterium]|nr:hypothetical protein [Bacteroidota bacterium]